MTGLNHETAAEADAQAFRGRLRSLLWEVLETPTAPFHEDAVAAVIRASLAACPHVTLREDAFGNLVASYRRGDAAVRWAFAVHMDHPGWVRNEAGEWEFLGGVPEESRDFPRREFGSPATFAMWDLPPVEEREGRVYARACDDLVGCAAMLAVLHELERQEVEGACAVLFTRAEEVGFVGAMELARSGLIAPEWQLISVETSAERPPAVMGQGVIVRVGDRTSIFDPGITATLTATAAKAQIPFQRCLMTGGTCEATAYLMAGYASGALCVALGNYHNVGPDRKIAPEYVALEDVAGLVMLGVALVAGEASDAAPARDLQERLAANREKHRRFFRNLNA